MTAPIWLSVAESHLGIAEIPGPQTSPVIARWARDLGVQTIYSNDEIAWCALYMNRLMKACQLPTTGTGYALLRARAFAAWGQECGGVALGAVLVFTRPEGAHVGLYLGEDERRYLVRGGNQKNAVSDAWIDKDRCIAKRWPIGFSLPAVAPIILSGGAPVSINEG